MPDYSRNRTFSRTANLFDMLSTPTTFEQVMMGVQPAGHSDVTITVGDLRIEWQPGNTEDFRGELQVDPVGCGAYVTLHVYTKTRMQGIEEAMDESLNRISELALQG